MAYGRLIDPEHEFFIQRCDGQSLQTAEGSHGEVGVPSVPSVPRVARGAVQRLVFFPHLPGEGLQI